MTYILIGLFAVIVVILICCLSLVLKIIKKCSLHLEYRNIFNSAIKKHRIYLLIFVVIAVFVLLLVSIISSALLADDFLKYAKIFQTVSVVIILLYCIYLLGTVLSVYNKANNIYATQQTKLSQKANDK